MAIEAIAGNLLEPLVYTSELLAKDGVVEALLIGGAGAYGYRRAKRDE